MVKFTESKFTYDYSFPTVALAYFLRYPNPYSRHVLSSDTISRTVDPVTGRLCTVRIHRKSSRIPTGVLKLLPKSMVGSMVGTSGKSESYILERSEVDVREGWMTTESRNLDWTGILSVIEKQEYQRLGGTPNNNDSWATAAGAELDATAVTTTVQFRSSLGDRLRARARKTGDPPLTDTDAEEMEPKPGFLASLSRRGIQRSIEAIASTTSESHLGKSKEGMVIVLERLRNGGIVGVLEGIRRDKEASLKQQI